MKKLFRISNITSIICLFILLLQSYELYSEYMSGKTVVNVVIDRLREQNLPAVTLCLPGIVSYERAAKYYDEAKVIYRNYQDYLKNRPENSTNNNLDSNRIII